MKYVFIMILFLPVISLAQQPAKPVLQNNINTQNVEAVNAEIKSLTENINSSTEQIKAKRDQIIALRTQQNATSEQKQKYQNELNLLQNKTNRSQQENAKIDQLKNDIKNLEVKLEKLGQQVKEISDQITTVEMSLKPMEEKMKELEQRRENNQKKAENAEKQKNDAVTLFAKVKILLDSLPEAEKAKLNENQMRTLGYYTNLYNSNANFKTAVLIESKSDVLNRNSDESVDKTMDLKNNKKAILSKLKEYLDRLSEIQNKNQL